MRKRAVLLPEKYSMSLEQLILAVAACAQLSEVLFSAYNNDDDTKSSHALLHTISMQAMHIVKGAG